MLIVVNTIVLDYQAVRLTLRKYTYDNVDEVINSVKCPFDSRCLMSLCKLVGCDFAPHWLAYADLLTLLDIMPRAAGGWRIKCLSEALLR